MAKCPACGFESPEGARWCDFCKEPFAKKAAPPEPAKAAAAAAPSKEVLAKAIEDRELAQELLRLDQESLPAVPPWLRWAAWALLGTVAIFAMTMAGIMMAKRSAFEQDAAVERRFQKP